MCMGMGIEIPSPRQPCKICAGIVRCVRRCGLKADTGLLEDKAGVERKSALLERVVDDFQLMFGEVSTALTQPVTHQTNTDVVAQRRYFDETARCCVTTGGTE